MKNKGLLLTKVENIMKKRYALEKIIPLTKFFGVLSVTLISFLFFFSFWFFIPIIHYITNFPIYVINICNVIILAISMVSGFCIWKLIGEFIPKFVLVGLLGWFLVGAGLMSDILVPGAMNVSNEDKTNVTGKIISSTPKHIQLPASRLTGMNEEEAPYNFTELTGTIMTIPDIFLMPLRSKKNEGMSEMDSLDDRLQGNLYPAKIPEFLRFNEFSLIRFLVFVLLLLIVLDLFITVSSNLNTGFFKLNNCFFSLNWSRREIVVKTEIFLLLILLISLFFLTLNYFFIMIALLFPVNVFLIRWEINQRGQNHKPFARSVLFLFLMHFFALTAGEVFFLIYLPVFLFATKGIQTITMYDAVIINWILLVGSFASILIGLITQVVWSGRRLTEKFD